MRVALVDTKAEVARGLFEEPASLAISGMHSFRKRPSQLMLL